MKNSFSTDSFQYYYEENSPEQAKILAVNKVLLITGIVFAIASIASLIKVDS